MPSASHTYIATIVMPVRNGAQYIDGALTRASETCARAGASQVEILVIDDGSTDRTAELASARTGEIPTLRIITSSANAGVAAARELGAIHARGRFIWFVDVDDEWPTDALDVMLAVADGTGADLVLAQAVYLTPAGREKPVEAIDHGRVVSRDEAFGMFLRDEITGHLWNKLATRELAASITYVRTQLHSDQSMVAQLIGGCRVAAITPTIVYRYIQRSGSLVRAGRAKHPSLMLVREVTHEVADQLTPTDQRHGPRVLRPSQHRPSQFRGHPEHRSVEKRATGDPTTHTRGGHDRRHHRRAHARQTPRVGDRPRGEVCTPDL